MWCCWLQHSFQNFSFRNFGVGGGGTKIVGFCKSASLHQSLLHYFSTGLFYNISFCPVWYRPCWRMYTASKILVVSQKPYTCWTYYTQYLHLTQPSCETGNLLHNYYLSFSMVIISQDDEKKFRRVEGNWARAEERVGAGTVHTLPIFTARLTFHGSSL